MDFMADEKPKVIPRGNRPGRPSRFSQEQKDAVIRLRELNYSWTQIAEETGILAMTASYIFKQHEKQKEENK